MVVVLILVFSGIYFISFYKYQNSEDVLLAPQQCPSGTTDCSDANGKLRDCCSSTETCTKWLQGDKGYPEYQAICEDNDGQCGQEEKLCEGRYYHGAVCCNKDDGCAIDGEGFAFCAPAHCGEDESACRNNLGIIVCCVKDGGGQQCINRGKVEATCQPGGTGICGQDKFVCGNAGQTICCNTATESCLPNGGEGNGPLCVPKNQPKPAPPGSGKSNS